MATHRLQDVSSRGDRQEEPINRRLDFIYAAMNHPPKDWSRDAVDINHSTRCTANLYAAGIWATEALVAQHVEQIVMKGDAAELLPCLSCFTMRKTEAALSPQLQHLILSIWGLFA
jgi:hypothetical protein